VTTVRVGGIQIGATAFSGGTICTPVTKSANFTASASEATVYEITATGKTVTLSSTDRTGTRYEFYDNAGNVAPNFTLTPNGGKKITSPAGVAATSVNLTSQGFWRTIVKMVDGNWLMSGI
jgi:hypothetical protein